MNDLHDPFVSLSDAELDKAPPRDHPEWLEPMLATLVDDPFSDSDWIFERKLDGERCLAFRDGSRVRLLSRNCKPLNESYPEIEAALAGLACDDFVMDGEVVAFEGRVTSFHRLQQRMQISDRNQARNHPIRVFYYVFDLPHLAGRSLEELPLRTRKKLLKRNVDFDDPIRLTVHRNESGPPFFEEACAKGWEGLIAKDAGSDYVHSRSRSWLKLKCVAQQELVIGGFTNPGGRREGFGALLVGYYSGGDLVYAGKVGTGFDHETLASLSERLEAIETADAPFDSGSPETRGVHWVRPELVAEVGFTEWTTGGKLRHPRFVGLRRDKDPIEVVREDRGLE